MPSLNTTLFLTRPPPPTTAQMNAGIEACLIVQRRGLSQGKRPFAAVLVDSDHTAVLLTHMSIDHVHHAESSLARLASTHFTQSYLWGCTLYSTWEPCAMCTSTLYWANIGRLVYAASEEQLGELTGKANEDNFTMTWSSREVLKGGQKDVEVWGPLEGLDRAVIEESSVYWSKTRKPKSKGTLEGVINSNIP